MKVGELKKLLEDVPDDIDVVFCKSERGGTLYDFKSGYKETFDNFSDMFIYVVYGKD